MALKVRDSNCEEAGVVEFFTDMLEEKEELGEMGDFLEDSGKLVGSPVEGLLELPVCCSFAADKPSTISSNFRLFFPPSG